MKFSVQTATRRGASAKTLTARAWPPVEVVDPLRVRFRLRRPWPDFMTFYGTSRHRGRLGRAQEVRRARRRRGLQEGPRRRRSLQGRRPTSPACWSSRWKRTSSSGARRPRCQDVSCSGRVPGRSRCAWPCCKRGEADIGDALPRTRWPRSCAAPQGSHSSPTISPRHRVWYVFTEQWDPNGALGRPPRAPGRQPGPRPREPSTRPRPSGLSKVTASIIPQSFDFYWPAPLCAHSTRPLRPAAAGRRPVTPAASTAARLAAACCRSPPPPRRS